MRLTKEGKSKTYGKIRKNAVTYEFPDNEPLIGLSAYQSDNKINQIGLYTLDVDCAATKPEETEESDEPEEPEEETKEELVTEKQPEVEEASDSKWISIVIIVIVIVIIVLGAVAGAILVLKKI